jgi:hypothetical protein
VVFTAALCKRMRSFNRPEGFKRSTGVQAVQEQREVAIKQNLMRRYSDARDVNALKIQICGNNITFSAPYFWLKRMGDDFAKVWQQRQRS